MRHYTKFQLFGLIVAPLILISMLLFENPSSMNDTAWKTASVVLVLAALWITEAIPIYVTSLLPIALFPLLEVGSIKEITAPYAHPLIFLFLEDLYSLREFRSGDCIEELHYQ